MSEVCSMAAITVKRGGRMERTIVLSALTVCCWGNAIENYR